MLIISRPDSSLVYSSREDGTPTKTNPSSQRKKKKITETFSMKKFLIVDNFFRLQNRECTRGSKNTI